MKIVHIINSLKKGGAEGNLYRLCRHQKKKYKNKIEIIIITLIDNGFYERELNKNGIKTYSLNINKKANFIYFFKKIHYLRNLIKDHNPDIIQSWMYHSNFITLFVPKAFFYRVFWNIRHSELNFSISKVNTILLSLICGLFSRVVPRKIIYCSKKSIKFHEKKHYYSKKKTILINNGYSDKSYYSSKILRSNFRKKIKKIKSDIILGFAGRYAKQKNIQSLLIAFSKIIKDYNNVYLCMVGKNINLYNKELTNIIYENKIRKRVFFLDEQKNLLEFYNGIDLLVSPSHSESFPNVIAESMLCSTPVLSSDAGCSTLIIKDSGFVMKHNDYKSIIHHLKKSINLFINQKKQWNYFKKKSRLQIKKNFMIENMATDYLKNWTF